VRRSDITEVCDNKSGFVRQRVSVVKDIKRASYTMIFKAIIAIHYEEGNN
jgi:hypothetical protein